jgi:hypothetical protein
MSATDAFSPAIARTKALLFRPFRWATWSRIALLGLATGEFSSGSCNFGSHSGGGGSSTSQTTDSFAALPQWWHNVPMSAIVATALLVFILVLVTLYVNSVARFMLFETVLTARASLREQWSRWHAQGRNYFGFQLILAAAVLGILLLLIGVPLLIAKNIGVLDAPRSHLALAIFGGLSLFTVFMLVILAATIVTVMGKDFIVPQMAMEQIDFVEAWHRYWQMLKAEKGAYAGYLGLKALMRLAATIIFGIIAIIFVLILLLPIIIAVAVIIGITGAAGLSWTPFTIALAAVFGTAFMVVLLFIVAFLYSPVTVFFPSYALLFFGSRYRPLNERMYPPGVPPSTPPEPPPIEPAPAGT